MVIVGVIPVALLAEDSRKVVASEERQHTVNVLGETSEKTDGLRGLGPRMHGRKVRLTISSLSF